ncbi:DNA repair protein RadC [Spirochaetia bacterium]|nr:DNA repair protein RadC [Spirochaetia bacterium]
MDLKESYGPECIETRAVKTVAADDIGIYNAPAISPWLLPVPLRPRERLFDLGPGALSDQELLQILLNNGIKGKNVSILAAELLERLESTKGIPSVKELIGVTGLGKAKASVIVAMLEYGRRNWGMTGNKVKHPSDVFSIVRHYANRKQERFICLSLNSAHEVLAVRIITIGLVNRTLIHPREVFADPLSDRATGICVCHNHPSGELKPSGEDDEVTRSLEKAASILGIRFLDHIIFSEAGYFSYRQAERLDHDCRKA